MGGRVEILHRVFVQLLEAVERDPELREMMEISLFKTERSTDLQAALAQRQESSGSSSTALQE